MSALSGVALALVVFVSHVPFLAPGYGTDSDSWKFASALREFSETGRYTASRLPGYPLMEICSVPIHALGPWAINTLSAIAAAACAWLVARLFARHGVRDAWLAGAAFAFVPAVFIAGTSSIDYLWALAFALAAWLEAAEGRAGRSGLLLGLAVGARLTSALFAVPLAILLWNAGRGSPIRRVLASFSVAGLVGAAWYVPVFQRYGWSMFSYSEIVGGQASALHFLTGMVRPDGAGVPWPMIAGQATVLLWGAGGCAALALALVSLAWQPGAAPRAGVMGRPRKWAMGSLVALVALLYVRLPHDEGYLIPAVPFILLALAACVTPNRFRAVCAALLLSPFLLGVDVEPPKKGATPAGAAAGPYAWRTTVSGETIVVEPFRGPVPRDHAKRVEQQRLADRLQTWWPQRPERFLLVAGNSRAMLYHLFPQAADQQPFVRALTPRQRAEAEEQGVSLFALPDAHRRMQPDEGMSRLEGVTLLAGTERAE